MSPATPPLIRKWLGALRLRRRPGGLFILALLLGMSGVLKIGTGVNHALAETDPHAAAPTGPSSEATAGEQVASCKPAPETEPLLAALKERETRLAERETKVAEQSKTIEVARAAIDEKVAALEAAEAKLAATIAQADKASEKDVSKLVAVYESMKPKDAAKLFAEMDPEFAAGFLAQMQPAAAAAVLSGLDPQKAYTISVVLAGRNANAPKS